MHSYSDQRKKLDVVRKKISSRENEEIIQELSKRVFPEIRTTWIAIFR
jgi:hypothetical protein